jgi:hypothetical protein
MKAILCLLMFSISIIWKANAQCDVQTNQREDGVTIKYLRPDRVGFSDRLILAISMQTNGEQFFISTLSVFEKTAVKLKGELTLKFANNRSSTFEHYRSEITTYNGYQAVVSIFITNESGLINILNSNITMIMLQLEDNVYQTIPVKMNSSILKQHYSCLRQTLNSK